MQLRRHRRSRLTPRASLAMMSLGALPAAAQARSMRVVVTDSSVREGAFEAVALSRDTIVSSYPRAAREIRFRFSIDGLENEFPSGTEHTIYLRPHGGRLVTALYRFGVEDSGAPRPADADASSEEGEARVVFRLDLRDVVARIRDAGHYDPPLGARIERGQLRHVYVLGDPAPLSWDYATLKPGSPAELRDDDGDGIYEASIPFTPAYTRPTTADGRAIWARTGDLRAFPALDSRQRLQDALYRLSLEELTQLVRPDGALSAGAKWPGVWTRDVAMSTVLALAIVAPDAARASLRAKVDSSGRIIQDTGTGGSWPISSDRVAWTVAAWEVFKATGDSAWLRWSYDVARRSAQADLHAVRSDRGSFLGESSFLDWREQSYPRWMQPADIYASQNLGTNAVHRAAYTALSEMARALGEPSAEWDAIGTGVSRAIAASLSQPRGAAHGQYRYGRAFQSLSPRAEGLGEAWTVLFGAQSDADRRAAVERMPLVEYGTPTFFPFTPGERLYHNGTVWPFVTAYWSWAAADVGNTAAVQLGLDANARATALFLTNKENIVAETGHYEGTALNSDRQLWSVAATLASTYRILFGMRLDAERLRFAPMVPPSYAGDRALRGVKYRGATLDVVVHGFGNSVARTTLDGSAVRDAAVPATLTGAHRVEIWMNGRWPAATLRMVQARYAPATPVVERHGDRMEWKPVAGATSYVAYRNGIELRRTHATSITVREDRELGEYQVAAENGAGDLSFLSEPLRVIAIGSELIATPDAPSESDTSASSGRHVRLTRTANTAVTMTFDVPRAGTWLLDVRYANGNGPVNTEDKGALRSLAIDGHAAGVLVFPQRGANAWTAWGWSNVVRARLTAGHHTITLSYTPLDANMNGSENTALLEVVRLTPVAPTPTTP